MATGRDGAARRLVVVEEVNDTERREPPRKAPELKARLTKLREREADLRGKLEAAATKERDLASALHALREDLVDGGAPGALPGVSGG